METDSDILGLTPLDGGPVTIPLDRMPEHAAALGRLLGHWAYLELQLTCVLQVLLRDVEDIPSRLIWQSFISTRGKIEYLQRMNWHVLADEEYEELRKELNVHLSSASKLNGIRNTYIHAVWSHPGGAWQRKPDGTSVALNRHRNTLPNNRKVATQEAEQFTPKDIQKDVAKIAELSGHLADWQGHAARAFPAQ